MNSIFSEAELFFEAKSLFENGSSINEIEERFLQKNVDEKTLHEIIQKIKLFKYRKRSALGFKIICVGAAFLLLSCMLTLGNDSSNSNFIFILYGLTSIGASIVFAGFVLIFG